MDNFPVSVVGRSSRRAPSFSCLPRGARATEGYFGRVGDRFRVAALDGEKLG
jgi:hypothetical protein